MTSFGSGKIPRFKLFLSLAMLVFSVGACHAQSGIFGLTAGQPTAPSVNSGVPPQTSYADLDYSSFAGCGNDSVNRAFSTCSTVPLHG